tara:strand:- start:781 stop:1683 length:903 start_codon:yes stop_codon:yes gene_type:complete
MLTKLYKEHLKNINGKINNKDIYNFEPLISNNFEKDKNIFSNFWKNCLNENKKDIRSIVELTKKIFLDKYSSNIYNIITNNRNKFIKIDELVTSANNVIPHLTPTKEEIEIENKKFLKDKDGLETDQGLFLSAILSNKIEGNHLCHSMLMPTDLALEKKEEFERYSKVQFDGASLEKFGKHVVVTLENGEYLNAEDERTLIPLEAAIDLALLDKDSDIAVLRGEAVKHPKYKGLRTFGAGINLTHLYQGQISFLWYIKRDMGAVNKVFRGLASKYYGPEEALFPLNEKPWIATLDTFAIG